MILKVQKRNVYGRILAFPVCEKSRAICSLKAVKGRTNFSFTPKNIKDLEEVGFKFKEMTVDLTKN